MKTFLYLCLLAGAIALPASERMKTAAVQVLSASFSALEAVLFRGDNAEVRMVNGNEFDQVIKESGRLVIVDFHHEETVKLTDAKIELDQSINRLPSTVLVAKVLADRNIELLDRLQIHNVPTLRVYRDGVLLEEFKGKIDNDRFIEVVQYHIDNPTSAPHRAGYIGPLSGDWLPEGVEERPVDVKVTPLEFDAIDIK